MLAGHRLVAFAVFKSVLGSSGEYWVLGGNRVWEGGGVDFSLLGTSQSKEEQCTCLRNCLLW